LQAKLPCDGGSGTSALTFNYTVGTDDHSVSALAITQLSLPSGATIKNSLGDDANVSAAATTFPGLGLTDTNSFGSTSLEGIGNNYFLYAAGTTTGPELQYNGTAVTVGEFGAWAPIGAVQTANGYEVAWKLSGSNLFTVWNTDSNGNYLSNPIGSVSGTSIALETMETTFNQDLNGDGVVGQYAAPNTTLQISQSLSDASGAATIGAHATLELTAASAPVTFAASTGMLKVDQPSTFSSEIFGFTGDGTLSGSDQIDLSGIDYNTVQGSYANGVLTVSDGSGDIAKLNFNGSYTLANFKLASDGNGGTIVYDPPVPDASKLSVNPTADGSPLSEGSFGSNLARFSNYMASTFATPGHVGGTVIAEASHSDQSFLSAPKHT
jgi:hypothetical protein